MVCWDGLRSVLEIRLALPLPAEGDFLCCTCTSDEVQFEEEESDGRHGPNSSSNRSIIFAASFAFGNWSGLVPRRPDVLILLRTIWIFWWNLSPRVQWGRFISFLIFKRRSSNCSAGQWISSNGPPSAILTSAKRSSVASECCSMLPESPKLLEDVRVAAALVTDRTRELELDEYLADDVLRLAIEGHSRLSARRSCA